MRNELLVWSVVANNQYPIHWNHSSLTLKLVRCPQILKNQPTLGLRAHVINFLLSYYCCANEELKPPSTNSKPAFVYPTLHLEVTMPQDSDVMKITLMMPARAQKVLTRPLSLFPVPSPSGSHLFNLLVIHKCINVYWSPLLSTCTIGI